jgi:hypothetical protein
VDASRTLQELRKLLIKHGANEFGSALVAGREAIVFSRDGITYRFSVPVAVTESEVPEPVRKAYRRAVHGPDLVEHENNRRLRSLAAVIKAQLIAIEDGILSFEETFIGGTVTDNGQTVAERMAPELKRASLEGRIPRALPGFGGSGL